MLFASPIRKCLFCGNTNDVVIYPSECTRNAYVCREGCGCRENSTHKLKAKSDLFNFGWVRFDLIE